MTNMATKKKIMLVALCIAGLFLLASCTQLDVIGKDSIDSFGKVLTAAGDLAANDDANAGYTIKAPDGAARFIWVRDFSKSTGFDMALEFDAQPFIDAGLDVSKLPQSIQVKDGLLFIGAELGSSSPTGEATPVNAYRQAVDQSRARIKYHTALDHYGVDLGGGNMFEWAKDTSTNDKDIVYVLNPQPFIDAGVAPDKVSGWVFAKVPTMDENNKPIEVDKLLKPFNLQ
jgi:hypothetical protein